MEWKSNRSSQADAMDALTLSSDKLKLTSLLSYKPPKEVATLQFAMCSSHGPIRNYFRWATVEARAKTALNIRGPHQMEMNFSLRDVAIMNREIQQATRDFIAEQHYPIGEIDELAYTISPAILQRLVPIANRAFDLLVSRDENVARSHDYSQLRASAQNFVQVLQLPTLFRDALGLACEGLNVPIADTEIRTHGNYELLLRQFLATKRLPPINPNDRFITHKSIRKQVLGLFEIPARGYFFLLKSPSGNPNYESACCYDLDAAESFPGLQEEWLTNHEILRPGSMARWDGRRKQDFIVKAIADAPSRWGLTFCLAESSDRSVGEDWYLDSDCANKWGYDRLDSMIFWILQIKCGQVTEEEEHRMLMRDQLNEVNAEKECETGFGFHNGPAIRHSFPRLLSPYRYEM